MSSREIKILLVDDEVEILYALKAVIETQGWTGLIAQNVKQALEIYKTDSPDIILIDYHMPHINGVEGVKMFRRQDPDIPIIVFTISYFIRASRINSWKREPAILRRNRLRLLILSQEYVSISG